MDKSKQILFFINSLNGGGAENVVVQQINYYLQHDYKCVVVTLYSFDLIIEHPNLELINLNLKMPKNKVSNILRMIFLKRKLKNNLKWEYFLNNYSNKNFSLIKADLPLSHKLASISPFVNKTIYVMHVSFDIVPKIFRPFHTLIMKKFYSDKKIACVSKGIYKDIIDSWSVPTSNVKVIYNSVPTINLNSSSENTKIKCFNPYFVVVGRLVKQKNLPKAIEIFKEGKFYENYKLVFLGEGSEESKIERIIKKNNLEEHVILQGFCNNIAEWLKNAELLLCTSKQEGFAISMLEALSVGTPVVSVDCPTGPSEILIGDLSKFLVPQNSSNSVYIKKINEVLKGNYPKITNNILSSFQIDIISQQWLDFYKTIN